MKFTILGCGSSIGVPWITGNWGNCNKNNKFNQRTRCSAFIKKKNLSILIDTSPDIKKQFIDNKIKNIDYVLYTHEHADQTSGIFELRPFFWKNKKRINVYGSKRTIKALKKSHTYCFKNKDGYRPILKANYAIKNFKVKTKQKMIKIQSFEVGHGLIDCTAYIINRVAYLSDCNYIPSESMHRLNNLDVLVIDCLKRAKHPSHFNLDEAIKISKYLKPKKTILTNLHTDLDYDKLKKILPFNIIPAYDGLSINLKNE